MTSEWQRHEVADLIARQQLVIGDGYRAKNDELGKHGLPFARAGNINEGFQFANADRFPIENLHLLGNKVSQPGDVVFTSKGTVGRFAYVREATPQFVYSPQLCFWRSLDRNLIDSRFLYYWMYGREFYVQFKGVAGQTDMAEYVSLTDQRRMHITLPGVNEQRSIGRILGTLDNRIELNRQMNESLEGVARALFNSWFVKFDPVRAKAEGRDCGLPQPLADRFPASFKDSDVGTIPVTWSVKTAGEVSERIAMGPFGSSIKVETFVDTGVPVISGQHLHSFMLSDTTFNFITEEHASRLINATVKRGDVVFTHAGNIGQVAFIPDESRYQRYVISQRQFYMRCDRDQVSPIFVAFYFSSEQGQHRLLANTSSSGVPSIARPVSYLRSIQLPIPPRDVLVEFDRLIRPMMVRFRLNREQSDTLLNIRGALLPKLVSGDLRIPDAERIVGEQV